MRHVLVPRPTAAFARPFAGFAGLGDFDRLFDELWTGFPGKRAAAPSAVAPRVDTHVTDDAITIRAEMPGLEEKDIDVSLEDGVLTLKGVRAEEKTEEEDEKGVRRVETYRGSFHRAFRLPDEVDEEKIAASYRNGVLELTLPKRPEVKPEVRSIPVTTA